MKHFIFATLAVSLSLSLISCANTAKNNAGSNSTEEVSLKADRSEFDELRKDMPAEVRKENDELAGILQLLRNPNGEYERPERIRERFNKVMRDKRARQNKQFQDEREDFTRIEKEKREEFTDNQKKEKEDFLDDKPSSEKRRRFFDRLDEKRSRFYDDARERRRSFEAEISTRRRNFEDYNREKTNLFNSELRNYQKEYDEHRKGEDLKKRMGAKRASTPVPQPNLSGSTDMNTAPSAEQSAPVDNSALDEFNQMPTNNTKKIESGD